MNKDWRTILLFAVVGFGISAACVLWQVLTDSSPPHPDVLILMIFILLCPPSLLTAPLIDVDIGTPGFYQMWVIVGIANAALYAIVGALYVGLTKKSKTPDTN
jgi:hypothetical protein